MTVLADREDRERRDLRQLFGFDSIQILVTFQRTGSFHDTAAALVLSERTVGKTLRDLSAGFEAEHNVPLLTRPAGSKTYALTDAGIQLAELLSGFNNQIASAVAEIGDNMKTLRIPCTSQCLGEFTELQLALKKKKITAIADSRSTSEFPPLPKRLVRDDSRGGAYGVSMYTANVKASQGEIDPGTIYQIHDDYEAFVLRSDGYTVISRESLGLEQIITVDQLLESDIELLMPDGGAVWDFMQAVAPAWEKRYPTRRRHIHDFNFGLQSLSRGAEWERVALISHHPGSFKELQDNFQYEYWNKEETLLPSRYQKTQVVPASKDEYVAITGVFHDTSARFQTDSLQSLWETTWRAAQEVCTPVKIERTFPAGPAPMDTSGPRL